MELKTIIDELIKLDINIQIQDGNLVMKGPDGKISSDVIQIVKENKEKLLEYLQSVNSNGYQSSDIPVAKLADGYPLSSSQLRLWILSQLEDASIAYNTPGMYIFEGELNMDALASSYKEVIKRHESLRTVFRVNEQGEVKQFVQPAGTEGAELQCLDLSNTDEQDLKLKSLLRQQLDEPFDLKTGPLVRGALYRLSSSKFVFSYVVHHIITDGWSMDVLIRELIICYNAFAMGTSHSLDLLRIQYKDYATWQQKQLKSGVYNIHKDYWMRLYEDELPVLGLMGDKTRPAMKTYNGGTVGKRFNATVTEGLRNLSLKHGATLFMGLLGSVNTLLYQYTGQEDIIIGSQIAGREHDDLENQIGCYLNTLALRTRFSGENGFGALLDVVKRVTLEAYAHRSYPFDELVENLHMQHSANRNALFDITVVLQNMDPNSGKEQEDLDALRVNNYTEVENVISKFDISFDFTEIGRELQVNIVYNNDIFNKDTIVQLLNHLEQLMIAITLNPSIPLNELDYLNKGEKDFILKSFNETAIAYPTDKNLIALFSEQVIRNYAKPAILFEEAWLTYGELDKKSNELAVYLHHNYMIKAGQPVGIMLDRSEKMIIAIFAILKSGGAYVPIDPDYPISRKEFMINDAGITVLITQTEYIFDLDYYNGDVFAIDVQLNTLEAAPAALSIDISSGDLAYIMYTSGSTGVPKGVLVEHGSVVRLVKSMNYVTVAETDTVLSMSNFSFDGSVFDIFASLLNGAVLVVTPKEHLLDFKILTAVIEKHEVSIFFITTALFNALVDNLSVQLPQLKYILFGGERVSLNHVKRFIAMHPSTHLVHVYGPTENTTFSTYYSINEVDDNLGTIPIGKPISNSACYILKFTESQTKILPIGVIGEICVGGKGLAKGYLNQPDLTSEKFVPNSFLKGSKIYRTGDLGRWLSNGDIEFIGRFDDQVKIRGHRIELGEIECMLQEHPDVDAAVVMAQNKEDNTKELVVYLVTEKSLNVVDIRSFLSEKLPAYMLPARYIRLATLPLNTNGKVDKKKLTTLGGQHLESGMAYVKPVTETEVKLVKIWEEILNKEKLSIKDDYFELGGSSLTAIIIIKRVIDEMRVTLPLKELFTRKNIENIARYIDDAEKAPVSSSYLEHSSDQDQDALSDISYNQLNYFCDWQFGTDLIIKVYEYNQLDINAFRTAVEQLIARHEILRTEFVRISGTVKQRILSEHVQNYEIQVIDVANEKELDELIAKAYLHTIDPLISPLIYIKIYKQSSGADHILFVLHHIVTDGYSTGLFQNELKQLYANAIEGKGLGLPPLHFQYKDFSRWQRNFVDSEEGRRHKKYWLQRLLGFNHKPRLSILKNDPVFNHTKAFCLTETIDAHFFNHIGQFVKSNQITLPVLLKSVLILVVNQLSGQEDVTLLTTVSGRNSKYYGDLDVTNLIGLFANPLLVRNKLNKKAAVKDYLMTVLNNFLDDLSYESYPLMRLINELPGIVPSEILDSSVFYNYHNYDYLKHSDYQPESVDGVRVVEIDAVKNAFGVIVEEFNNGLKLEFVFNTGIFDRENAIEVKTLFFDILKLLIENPDASISNLDEQLGREKQVTG